MSDIISTGISGLSAVSKMMDIASHNISNVDTPGYTRERAELAARYNGVGLNTGDGVEIIAVSRLHNQFLEKQIERTSSTLASVETYLHVYRNIAEVINNDQNGLGASIADLSQTLAGMIAHPSDPNSRAAFYDAANMIVNRFHNAKDTLNQLSESMQAHIKTNVEEANNLIRKIADLNKNIVSIERDQGSSAANDLRDLRQQALKELNTYIPVQLVDNQKGNIALYTGKGQLLIQDSQAFSLSVQQSNQQGTLSSALYIEYNNSHSRVDHEIQSGKIGAAINAQYKIIHGIKNQLGIVAAAIAKQFNHMQSEGLTSRNEWGKPIFNVGQPNVEQSAAQQGHVVLQAAFGDVSQAKPSDYQIHFDGTHWHILRENDQQESVVTTLPPSIDGLQLTLTGTPQAGDHFVISPGASAMDGFKMVMNSPDDIAMALPIRTIRGTGNRGSISVKNYDTDPLAPRPLATQAPHIFDTVHINFTDATHYDIQRPDGTTILANQTYQDGQKITLNGWTVELTGEPKSGDVITVEKNTDATGDTHNLQKVASFATKGYFDQGNKNLTNFYSEITERIGTKTRESSINYDANNKLLAGLQRERASVSGVNLNEEAGNLVRLQELYAANAKVIQMGSRVIDSLISLFRS